VPTFIIHGIIQGAVIGLIAIGIVLTYKGAKVFNFAQAEFGTIAAFLLLYLSDGRLPYPAAWVASLVLVGVIGWLFERLIVRPLFAAPRVTLLVATAGFTTLAIGLELIIGGVTQHQLDALIPGTALSLFNQVITWQQMLTLAIFAGLAAALSYFFSKTDLGLAVLATSQEPVATELVGIGTKKMSSFIWTFSALLGGLAGLLQAPEFPFAAGFMSSGFLLSGFAAAVVGGITSLTGAFVGGMLIGISRKVVEYLDFRYVEGNHIIIPGLPELVVFILLISVLYARPAGLLGKEA